MNTQDTAGLSPIKLDETKMAEVAGTITNILPGYGFALITFEIQNGSSNGKYISNVVDDYMIRALESQLNILKSKVAETAV